ncbi:endonuclease/exonuclease/phosphatase family protein [Salipiger mucosus]|uniref:3-phytase n=1 Tax=Salipiger mucosus DSM 16094 TaxID=1123237 RepID=S9QNJ2_9RHOB|nr:endonuclease/exonuclease/phosphatase family protein [Salipiger mucosus]EPX83011.1 3-phytase precursor [Salipiger mucosus DSM 16094]
MATAAAAESLTLATWHVDLSRRGPGLLLRDLLEPAAEIEAVVAEIAAVDPDVLVLTDIDYDRELVALTRLAALLEAAGAAYPYRFALRPNTGRPTGLDLDGDGLLGGPRDAQGYGEFSGQGGMAVLSRRPFGAVRDFSALLWADLPGNLRIESDPAPGVQRLSSSGHWALPVKTAAGPVELLIHHATPPVFDGPEDRNGRRNADELRLWLRYLDGDLGAPPPARFVLIGDANLDPARGDGRHAAMRDVLEDPRFRDPLPGQATVSWEQTGPMRVSYILPSAGLRVSDAAVRPVAPPLAHRLVWVTLSLPAGAP